MDTTDPIARRDQASAEIRHVAPVLGTHFRSLLAEGFERAEALALVQDLQAEMIGCTDADED